MRYAASAEGPDWMPFHRIRTDGPAREGLHFETVSCHYDGFIFPKSLRPLATGTEGSNLLSSSGGSATNRTGRTESLYVKRQAIGTPDRHRRGTPHRRWGRLVPVANRRVPRASRSTLTSDGAVSNSGVVPSERYRKFGLSAGATRFKISVSPCTGRGEGRAATSGIGAMSIISPANAAAWSARRRRRAATAVRMCSGALAGVGSLLVDDDDAGEDSSAVKEVRG
jgi:hypothetical protein